MKTPRFYLEHIYEQTQYPMAATAGIDKPRFLGDRTLILAAERSLEIIGEAVVRIDEDF